MKYKKILIFIHDISLAIQMLSYLEQLNINIKQTHLTIIIPKGLLNYELKNDVNIIFNRYTKEIISIKLNKIQLFTAYNIMNWTKIFTENKKRFFNVKKFIKNKKIDLNTYDKIFYSNESISKYFLKLFKKEEKIFFFHGIGDVKVFLKQDIIHRYKNLFFQYLNRSLNNLELTNIKSKSACIYKNYYKKKYQTNNLISINKNIFIKNFKNYSKYKLNNYNFDTKRKFILVLLKFPTFKVNESDFDRKNYILNYMKFKFNKFSNFIKNSKSDSIVILKTKKNVKSFEINLIDKIASKIFTGNKFIIFKERKKSFLNAEIIGTLKNCEFVISKRSSADIIINIVSPKKKILQYHHVTNDFENETKLLKKKKMDSNKFNIDKYIKSSYYKEL